MQDFAYPVSRDYRELARQMEQRRIACIVDYGRTFPCRDIAATIFDKPSVYSRYRVSARGIEYIAAKTVEDFEQQCTELNLEWVTSAESAAT